MGRAPLQGGDRIADDVLDVLRRYAADGTPCALATVVRTEPPTSARPGDKAVITAEAADELGLAPGVAATALIKATEVMVMR